MPNFTSRFMTDELFIERCIELALKGEGRVAPNPLVGAVLVADNRIIGEGYHEAFGQAHAEVNCLKSVAEKDRTKIAGATLYVSLEPCAHYGKTPPCVDLILKHKIARIVIGIKDCFSLVNGKSIEKLKANGVEVLVGICEEKCRILNKRFHIFYQQKRPYIVLKWAQTRDGFIGNNSKERLFITNELSNRLTHLWRKQEMAILVGYNTAINDNPSLLNKYYHNHPIRMVIDKNLTIPRTHQLYNEKVTTIFFNALLSAEELNNKFVQLNFDKDILKQIMDYAYTHQIQSILVEGGAKTLQSFIHQGLWDECRVFTATDLSVQEGIKAPILSNAVWQKQETYLNDIVTFWRKN